MGSQKSLGWTTPGAALEELENCSSFDKAVRVAVALTLWHVWEGIAIAKVLKLTFGEFSCGRISWGVNVAKNFMFYVVKT